MTYWNVSARSACSNFKSSDEIVGAIWIRPDKRAQHPDKRGGEKCKVDDLRGTVCVNDLVRLAY
jgi:hypothetical protein